MADISNATSPERLEQIAISYIGRNLTKTICYEDEKSFLRFREGVNLPQVISDRMFHYLGSSLMLDPMQKQSKSDELVKYCKIFCDNKKCKLRRITLKRAPISDDMVQVLADLADAHPLLEIDLTDSSDMNGDDKDWTPPYNHSILLPGFFIKSCGKSLQKLILNQSFLAYSINQIMMFSGKKAKVLGQDVYLTSDATVENLPLWISKENAPVLSSLDIAENFTGWFLSIDPENPPPLKVVNVGGYYEMRLNPTVKKILSQLAYGEEDYVLPTGRQVSTVAHSKSERKLQSYEFFKKIAVDDVMLERYVKSANVKENLREDDRVANDFNANPQHNFLLSHINLLSMKDTLQSLGLFNTWLTLKDFEDVIFQLKNLQHLDVGWPAKHITASTRQRPSELSVWQILDNLPQLKSLDISGTCYGEKLYNEAEVVEGEMARRLKMERARDPLNFLGLWGTSACKLKGLEQLALKITGHSTEDQLLSSLEQYLTKSEVITDVLSRLSNIQQDSTSSKPNLTLKLCLQCVNRYPTSSNLLFVCAANIYYLLQSRMQTLTVYQKRDVLRAVTKILERNLHNQMLVRNCMVIYFNFDLPADLMFEFDRIAELILKIFKEQKDVPEINLISGNLCNALVCSLEVDVKTKIKKLEYIKIMINIIESRLNSRNGDEVLDIAWSALWNVTDETPSNSEDFLNMGGLSLFLQCYNTFQGHNDLVRNMMGLMGNIAEVGYLRPHLAKPEVLDVVIRLVRSTNSGIEVAYNACGVLSNLLIDDSDILKDADLEHIRTEMRQGVLSWDEDVARNINYRTFDPLVTILRCPKEPVTHLWSLWAIHNLCNRDSKYVGLVIKGGGVGIIKSLRDTTDDQNIRYFAGEVVKKCNEEEGSAI